MSHTKRPEIEGIHHVKLAVTDLDRSLKFYEIFLGAERIPEADHHKEGDRSLYAYILNVPALGTMLELRLNAEQAEKHRFFDQFTVAVKDRETLAAWQNYLSENQLSHSPIIPSIQAWIVVVEDPDQNRWRLYTLEKHSNDVKPDENNDWLKN